jgi:hypothetical protein
MRALWFALAASMLVLPVACDSGDDAPGRQVPRTVPPTVIQLRGTLAPNPLPVRGTGPVYEASVAALWG